MSETPNYYAVIPADVRYDKRLSLLERLLYGEITALSQKTGQCWATNSYFAELYGKQPNSVSHNISNLAKYGYIEVSIDKESGNRRVMSITPNRKRYNDKSQEGVTINRNTPITINHNHNNTSVNNTRENKTPYSPPWDFPLAAEESEELAKSDKDFQTFFDAYPPTPNKGKYRTAFQEWKYKRAQGLLPPLETLLEALAEQKECRYAEPKYIPSPAKWIREEEWRFEPDPGEKAALREKHKRRREEEFREMYKAGYTEDELKAFALKHNIFPEIYSEGDGGENGKD